MRSQLAKELMENLLEGEFYAKNNLDEASETSADEAECPIMGHEMVEAGKFKGKKTYT